MSVVVYTEMRKGRIWCLTHDRWWKQCDCPGQFSLTYTVTEDLLKQSGLYHKPRLSPCTPPPPTP